MSIRPHLGQVAQGVMPPSSVEHIIAQSHSLLPPRPTWNGS